MGSQTPNQLAGSLQSTAISYVHKAQAGASLVLLPSGPDTIRESNLALWPYGTYYFTLSIEEMLVKT